MRLLKLVVRIGASARSRMAVLLCLSALCAIPVSAQTGTISGKVINEEGEPFAYTQVALDPQAGYTYSDGAYTEEDGTFRFTAVPVGDYKLSAFADGFKAKESIVDIRVSQGSAQSFTITLIPIAALTDTIVVTGKIKDIVDTRKTNTSMTLDNKFIGKIPLQNKRVQDIVFLFPGVTRSGSSDSTDISIGGGTSSQIGYRINGMSANDSVNGGLLFDVPTAAIESFKLITGGFNAEYGEQSSGIAEIVTKAGTNEIDFSYGIDFRDTGYGAQPIGGLDDAARDIDDLFRAEGSPLEAELAAGFRLLNVDPVSTTEDDNNPTPRHRVRQTVSTGGPIKKDKIWFHSTLESTADDYGNPYASGMRQSDQVLFTGKVNWNVFESATESKRNTLEFTANVDVSDASGFNLLTGTRSINTISSSTAWTLGALDRHVFNDTTFLETRVNLRHTSFSVRPEDVRTRVGTRYRVFLPPGGFVAYTIGAAGVSVDETVNAIRGETSLTKAYDNHDVKGGISYEFTSFKSFEEDGDIVNELRVVDDRNLFGAPARTVANYSQFGEPTRTDDTSWQALVFLQDNWRVTENLSVDMGLRGDYQSFVGELFLAPRVGFSLDPIGDGKTRLYGNYGLFYDNIFANALQFAQQPDTLRGTVAFTDPFRLAGNARFSQISIEEIYKEALATPQNSLDLDSVAYLDPTILDRFRVAENLSAPLSKTWSMGIERRLPGDTRIQIGYSRTERTHQLRTTTETVSVAVNPYTPDERDVILESTGEGAYEQWSFEFQRPFSDKWEINMSYTQSKNNGPIAPPDNPVDPNDVFYQNGELGNDRTHVAKMQGRARIGEKAKLDISGDFTWQTGTPISATLISSNGDTFYPFGRNSFRLPSSRQLNFGMQRVFHTADGKLNITGRVSLFNLLNELNVFGALARFETPPGLTDPRTFPPLRTDLVVTDVDVSRSMELGVVIGF